MLLVYFIELRHVLGAQESRMKIWREGTMRGSGKIVTCSIVIRPFWTASGFTHVTNNCI